MDVRYNNRTGREDAHRKKMKKKKTEGKLQDKEYTRVSSAEHT
jgi:hypothetical protein